MRKPGDLPQVGDMFRSVVHGVPVILQIDEIISVDEETLTAELKTHIVERIRGEGVPS